MVVAAVRHTRTRHEPKADTCSAFPQFPKDKYRVVVWEKDPKLAARESVCAYVNKKAHVDFLVVGFVGRKGPKL